MVFTAYTKPTQQRSPLSYVAFFAFFTVCSWSLYTSKYSAKLEAIKVSPPDLESQSLKIFAYHLPKRFNHDLLAKIKRIKNGILGIRTNWPRQPYMLNCGGAQCAQKTPKRPTFFSSLFLPPPAYHSLYINHNSESMRES